MRTSRPTVYKRPNPQDIYYNGNIYDPKPTEEVDTKPTEAAQPNSTNLEKTTNPINQSNTGLQIY